MGAAPPRPGRRALLALGLVLLAFSPALLVLTPRSSVESPPPRVAPALPEPDPEPVDNGEQSPSPPPAADVEPAGATGARSATAGPWKGLVNCQREKVSGGQYNRCLYDVTRTSEQALEAELANAFSVIEARTDLQGTQRARWKTQLDEAQSRFLLFRNLDCQGVAPFEGPRGIGNFEQRALCLIAANRTRAADLKARYGNLQPGDSSKATPSGPAAREGTWTHAVPPRLE